MQAEASLLATEMSTRVELVADELESHLSAMKLRPTNQPESAYEKARREALASAEGEQLRLLLRVIVSGAERRLGAIPFAVDAQGRLYASDPREEEVLGGLGVAPGRQVARRDTQDWVIAERKNPETGIVIGVARPVGEALRELRKTAGRNLALGLGLALVAALGILPLSRRMTRHLASLTDGAERLARGERDVRVAVPHGREFARLAQTFNRMARDLRANEERLLEQERLRKELEIGRRIQEELLPRAPLRARFAEASGVSIPAREVGGDFFNYFALPRDEVTILIGDVSGKGVPAALLMASLQAKIRARLALERDLVAVVDALDRELDSTEPLAPYFTLFLALLEGRERAPPLRQRRPQHAVPAAPRRGRRAARVDRPAARSLSRRRLRAAQRRARATRTRSSSSRTGSSRRRTSRRSPSARRGSRRCCASTSPRASAR